ncbi:zwei Ig domain protein zig-8-like [Babylonia areolata]|uniref:zwei Ig domain protein zig-8-like n=1 Tax=Babylonia areolata TaxID=304850 RepID=UPI003FD5C5D0
MRVVSRGCTLRHLRRELFLFCHVIIVAMVAAFTEKGVTPDPDVPFFLPRPYNVTYHRGDNALLPCAIDNVGTKTIIWRRASDPNPLTIGELVYVEDGRYSVQRVPQRKEWNLLIRDVQRDDQGVYECQVSSRLKLIHHLMLRVNMTERPQRGEYDSFRKALSMNGTSFVEKGDPIRLTCNASGTKASPDDLEWFKDGLKVTADRWQHVRIERFRSTEAAPGTLVSVLDKRYSEMGDAGTYVCRSSDLGVTSMKVHVLNAGSTNVRRGTLATSSNATGETGGQGALLPARWRPVFLVLFTVYVIQVH